MALNLTISSGCADGGGFANLEAISGTPGPYQYALTRISDGQMPYAGPVTSDQLPLAFEGLYDDQYSLRVFVAADPSNFGTAAFSLSCNYANPNPGTPATPGTCDLLLSDVTADPPASNGVAGAIHFRARSSHDPVTVMAVLVVDGVSGSGAVVPGDSSLQTISAGLVPGDYELQAQDQLGCKYSTFVTIPAYSAPAKPGCTDPSATNYDPAATVDNGSCAYAPVVRQPYFAVPAMQSLRFVEPGKPGFDNVLLADETPLDYTNPGYCQLVETGDTLVLQAHSNYQGTPVLKLYPCGSEVATRTIPGQKVQQGAGTTAAFEVYLRADTTSGRTRVYFNHDALPLPFLAGQRITISATGTVLDGTYPIHDVLEDAAAAVPYLLLYTPYPSGQLRVDGSLTTTYVVQAYDTYQFVLPFAGLAKDCYTAKITATDNEFGSALAVSEPIDVAAKHKGSVLVVYRNFDNAFDLNYSHGQVNRLRVTGRFFERQTVTDKTVLRNDNSELVLLSASVYGKVELETLLLPGYLHQKLAVAFCHDFVTVNGEGVTLEQDYTTEPVQRYMLSRGTALLELKKFLGAGNRDDLGDVDAGGGPFLAVNEKYLNATPL